MDFEARAKKQTIEDVIEFTKAALEAYMDHVDTSGEAGVNDLDVATFAAGFIQACATLHAARWIND